MAGVTSPTRRSDWLWKVSNKNADNSTDNAAKMDAPASSSAADGMMAPADSSASPSRHRLDCPPKCCPPPPACCPAPECKICCCKGPCGCTTITEKKNKCGCVRTIETVNKCGCTKNTIQKGPCGCIKTFERRDKCGNCEKRMEKVNNCGCCRMNLCIGPCGCTKTTETKTPCGIVKTHEAKSHCGCLNIRETCNKCGRCKMTECILPGGRCCRCLEERNQCGCKKMIENVNKCKGTCCKLNVCVGPQGCCKTQICKNPCMCYRATEGHNKAGCCKVSEWKNKCGCLKVSERRNKCGFGCKKTICITPCGCRKIVENISPCGCSTCIEGCNKLNERGCCRVVSYKCQDCKTKCKCDDESAVNQDESATNKVDDQSANKKAMHDAGSTDASRAALYDLPQNPPGSPSRKRRFDDTCEFCGGSLDGPATAAVAARPRSRSANRQYLGGGFVRGNDDSFLYDVYPSRNGGVERRSGGESQPFTVSSIINHYRSSKLNPFSLSNSLSRLSVLKLSLKDHLKVDKKDGSDSQFLLTGVQTAGPKICRSCADKGAVSCDPACKDKDKDMEIQKENVAPVECSEGCCCFSCSPVPCALGCCCPACCPALIVPMDNATAKDKDAGTERSKKESKRRDSKAKSGEVKEKHHRHGEKSKLNIKEKKERHHQHKDNLPAAEKKASRVLQEASKTEIA